MLQFCDFYCAILSFWVTIVALAMNLSSFSLAGLRIGAVKNLLDLSGAILVAILVQYNRTGVAVLLLPLCLGLILVLVSLVLRYLRRRRLPRPRRSCLLLVLPAGAMALAGLGLTVMAGDEGIYPYTHRYWYI